MYFDMQTFNNQNFKNETVLFEENKILLPSENENNNKYFYITIITFFMALNNSVYFISENYIQGFQQALMANPYNYSNSEYGLLYSIGTIPNCLLPIYIGIKTDTNGFNNILIFFLEVFVTLGSFLSVLGAYYTNFPILLLARFFLTVGLENMDVLMRKVMSQVYEKKYASIGWSFYSASFRLGTLMVSLLVPQIYCLTYNVTSTFVIGIIFSIIHNLSVFLIFFLLYKFPGFNNMRSENPINAFDGIKSVIKNADIRFWLVLTLSFLNSSALYAMFSNANKLAQDSMNIDNVESGYFLTCFCCVALIVSPFLGFLIAKIGYYIYAHITASFINICVMVMFLLFFNNDIPELNYIPFSVWGFGSSLNLIMALSLTEFVAKENQVTVTFGITKCIRNFGVFFGQVSFGIIKDLTIYKFNGFFWALIEIISFFSLMILIALILIKLDKKENKLMNFKFK